MRTRELKADVVYATCEGVPVRPRRGADGTIHAGWRRHIDGDTRTIREVEMTTAPEDAWAACVKAKPQAGHFTGPKGLRVKVFEYDRDGSLTDEGAEQILDPKDIKGTWADFLMLHPDVVEARYDARVEKWLTKEHVWRLEQLNATLKPLGMAVETYTSWVRGEEYETKVSLVFKAKAPSPSREDPALVWQLVLHAAEMINPTRVAEIAERARGYLGVSR